MRYGYVVKSLQQLIIIHLQYIATTAASVTAAASATAASPAVYGSKKRSGGKI